MKTRILLTILFILMIRSANAQNPTMTLTFTADNNGLHVPLNSILIENLTQGGDTTLYAPDTVFVMDYVVGMEEFGDLNGNSFSLFQNYPNPMKGKTKVSLYLPEKENILITVSDIIGREMVSKEFHLDRGKHSFTFYPGGESLYFLTARANRHSGTIKMFNSPSNTPILGYCKLEYNGWQTDTEEHKSGKNLNNFGFVLGHQLKFTSSTGLGERTITSFPAGDNTYYFNYTGDPCPGAPTVYDIDGNVYNTVLIGGQCWMKENLKTTTYNNGASIPNVTDDDEWSNLTSGAYAWLSNDISNKDNYGALYNWFTTVDPKGLCPTGWHVPTNDEWSALTDYIGGTSSPHGNELKSCRRVNSPLGGYCNTSEQPRWKEDTVSGINNYGTDDYGFSGLPGGYRDWSGYFSGIGGVGNWWSSTAGSSTIAWLRSLQYSLSFVSVSSATFARGFSVRCLRD